jgi:PTS system ascorbate-specific IIA component
MTVGLLLVTHNQIGADLLAAATTMLGMCPLATEVLPVAQNSEPRALLARARQLVEALDQGEGVLVLTDIYGSTPSNIACSLLDGAHRVQAVAGLNLPMLIRALNYPRLSLDEIAGKALSGGKDGVLLCACKGR